MGNSGHTSQGTRGLTMQRGICHKCKRSVALTRDKKAGTWFYRPHKESVPAGEWCLKPGSVSICWPHMLESAR